MKTKADLVDAAAQRLIEKAIEIYLETCSVVTTTEEDKAAALERLFRGTKAIETARDKIKEQLPPEIGSR